MKRKSWLVPRNPFVVPAKHCKAGAHSKTTKALRRADKVELRGRSFEVKQPAFNRQIRDHWPCAPTKISSDHLHGVLKQRPALEVIQFTRQPPAQ